MEKIIRDRIEKIEKDIVPEGYKKTSIGIIPQDWQVKKLGEICEINKENLNKKDLNTNSYYYLDLSSIENGNILFPKEKINMENLPSRARRKFKKGDILLSTVRPNLKGFGYINFDSINYLCSTGFAVLSPEKNINSLIVYYNLFTKKIENKINSLTVGSNYPALNNSEVFNLNIPIPPLEEQEKIADILTLWDEYIENMDNLIEKKEELKKGLMQKLLTGEKRLPGYAQPWKKVKLGDVGKTYNGLSGKTKKDFGVGNKFITYKNIFDNDKIDINIFDLVNINDNEKQNIIKYGDIFFTTSSETPEEVGMTSVLLEDTTEDIYLNSFCFGYRLNNFNILLPEFARYYFRSKIFRKNIFKLAQGSTRFNLSKNEILKITINLPPLDEQRAIADILSKADEEIELLKELRDKKLEEKKGLMQLLLTGIIRV